MGGLVIERPPLRHESVLYSNMDHMLNREVAEFLAHNQDTHALHTAKGYCGYVFCCLEPSLGLVWYEEVWQWHVKLLVLCGLDLLKLIHKVTDNLGYA